MAVEQVELTQTEIQEKGAELAQKLGELYNLRAEKKDAMNEFKTKIDATEREISQLSEIVRTGKEYRSRTFFDNEIEN